MKNIVYAPESCTQELLHEILDGGVRSGKELSISKNTFGQHGIETVFMIGIIPDRLHLLKYVAMYSSLCKEPYRQIFYLFVFAHFGTGDKV